MEDEHRSAGGPTTPLRDVRAARPMTGQRVFRSPFAVLVWWIWAVFALANLVDLAVQGRDRLSLLAAIGLLLVTGLLYAGAWRPRIVPDDDGMTISNPLRDHRVGWPAVSLIEATELVRIRCEWPVAGDEAGKRVIYAWAVHSARRKERIKQLRREVRGAKAGGYAAPQETSSVAIDADQVAAELSELAQRMHGQASEATVAVPPVSRWHWPSIAAIVVPGVALLIVALL